MRAGSLFAGLAGAFFVVIVGNLGNVKLILDSLAAGSSTTTIQSTLPGMAKLVRVLGGAVKWLVSGQPLPIANDWWFWNASRVIPDTINEFPFFTFTYADLHAHMVALPFTLLALALAVALVRLGGSLGRHGDGETRRHGEDSSPPAEATLEPDARETSEVAGYGSNEAGGARALTRRRGDFRSLPNGEPSPWHIAWHEVALIAAMGFVIGTLRATNTWDFPTYVLVGMAALAVLEGSRRLLLPFPAALDERLVFLFRAAVAVIWRTVILMGVASLTAYPFTKYYATAYAGLQRYTEATTKIPDYLTVHGFFLALVVIYLISEAAGQARQNQLPGWVQALLPWVIALVVLLVGAGWVLKARVWLVALPLAAVAVILSLGRDIPPARRLALLLIALALAITMGVEVVRQKDDIGRMNTVFKFYMQAWVLFAVTSAYGLATWAVRALQWRTGWRRLAWAVAIILFLGAMVYPVTAAPAKVRDRFSSEASPHGLDGMAYMDKAQYFDNNLDLRLADDKAAMLWMLNNVPGSPVILEAQVPEYRWGSRFSIYTGLPTVQGWNWHQRQQRSIVPSAEVERRVNHVQEIYNTTDLARAQKLLELYNVSYIIVGQTERAYYSPEGLAKFDALVGQGYLQLVYAPENGAVRIYKVVGPGMPLTPLDSSPIGPQPVPTPTPLPDEVSPPEGESPPQPSLEEATPLPGAEPFVSPPQ